MSMSDPVVWGSALTVVISVVVLIFLGFKVAGLMKSDANKHKSD
jgi:hypothetical protein